MYIGAAFYQKCTKVKNCTVFLSICDIGML